MKSHYFAHLPFELTNVLQITPIVYNYYKLIEILKRFRCNTGWVCEHVIIGTVSNLGDRVGLSMLPHTQVCV